MITVRYKRGLTNIGVLWFTIGCCAAYGKDTCAVSISVVHADNSPVDGPEAMLLDHEGAVVSRKKVVEGRVEFCDFDFGRYSVRIGGDRCGSATIGNIRVVFGIEQKLKAVINTCAGEGDPVSAHGCLVFVRARSPSAEPLAEVNIVGADVTRTTDSYGRALMAVRQGATDTFTLSKLGYKTQTLAIDCTLQVYDVLERAVTMDPDR